ncbi:MAG: hypothetical protein Q8P29_01800 [Candidatus Levybacteria bacterium]|nr:hypothetical protein [Candidatus Levybacteria bacterium]
MTLEDLNEIITHLINECVKLKNKYVEEKDLIVDYVCIFTHSQEEYGEFHKLAKQIGKPTNETSTGPIYAFLNPPETIVGKPKLLKIRKPDETRPQRGDVDFNTDYENFKNKYQDDKRFTLIKRKNFDILELRDDSFDVLAYFSSTPPSKQLKIE